MCGCGCSEKKSKEKCSPGQLVTSRQRDEVNPCPRPVPQTPELRRECIGAYELDMYQKQEGDICGVNPKEPYLIPGYTGHVPTLQSRSGGTFGHDTHEVLVLSTTAHQKPSTYGQGTHICPAPMHEPYHLPGYTGHVPGLQFIVGGTFGHDTHKLLYSETSSQSRQENLSPYRPGQGNGRCETTVNHNQVSNDQCISTQTSMKPHSNTMCIEQSTGPGSSVYQQPKGHYYKPQYKDCIGDTFATTRDVTLVIPCVHKESKVVVCTTELDDTQGSRTLDKGRDGHRTDHLVNMAGDCDIPYGYAKYGEQRQKYTNSVLYDFTSNYRRRQSTEWAPANISRPDPPAFDIPGEIYSTHTGMLPGYSAHIPGALFRYGKTFTVDSRDAKRALRGDRF